MVLINFKTGMAGGLFLWLGFGQILRSRYELGWEVFYGPVVKNLELIQIMVTAGVMGWFYLIRNKKWKWMLPMAFFLEPIVRVARVSVIEGEYMAGILISGFRFVGVVIVLILIEMWLTIKGDPVAIVL